MGFCILDSQLPYTTGVTYTKSPPSELSTTTTDDEVEETAEDATIDLKSLDKKYSARIAATQTRYQPLLELVNLLKCRKHDLLGAAVLAKGSTRLTLELQLESIIKNTQAVKLMVSI